MEKNGVKNIQAEAYKWHKNGLDQRLQKNNAYRE